MWLGKTIMVAYRYISQPASLPECRAVHLRLAVAELRHRAENLTRDIITECRYWSCKAGESSLFPPRGELSWSALDFFPFCASAIRKHTQFLIEYANRRHAYYNFALSRHKINHSNIFSSIMFWSVAWLCFNGSTNTVVWVNNCVQ